MSEDDEMEGMADFNSGGQNRWMTEQSWSAEADLCDPGDYSYTSLATNGPNYSLATPGPIASQPLVPRQEEQSQQDDYMYNMMMDSMVSGATFPNLNPAVAAPSLGSHLTLQAQASQNLQGPGQQMLGSVHPAMLIHGAMQPLLRSSGIADSMAQFNSGISDSNSRYGNSNPVIPFPGPTDSYQSGWVSVQGS
ncbi:hypothetical protein BD289DRAFT_479574 [Coniella lustricola]|uniref:Uncharacterized protein n=1 Tax=Coniella lustricola TaxID=2025994 RepID=A0A2T3AII6_9PEZI|nr:hypothetical protein BD289DRAFT_479574 [Coniella lustricola]